MLNLSYSVNVSWCRVSKTNETTDNVSVDKNSGFERKAIITFKSDSETVKVNVTQKSAFDHRDMISPYKQITTSSCVAICAGMCVLKSPTQMKQDGLDLDWANWAAIAQKYGYKLYPSYCEQNNLPQNGGLSDVFNMLKAGYPVIALVNSTNFHWVTIYSYQGTSTSSFSAADFMCADPLTGNTIKLNQASNYNKVTQYICYVKK